jgi:hypothetical protein
VADSPRTVALKAFARAAATRARALDFGILGTFAMATMLFVGAVAGITLLLYVFSEERELLARIPAIIQVFSCFIVLLAGIFTKTMLAERARVLDNHSGFLKVLKPLSGAGLAGLHRGIPPEKLLEVRGKSEASGGAPKRWWQTVEESLEIYTGADGREGWFTLRPVTEILDEETLVWDGYHASFYQAIPGILTALGLLATFIAILQGLSGVSYNPQDSAHPVTGIDTLINGLSGKFVSSIVALMASIVFTFIEKKVCERAIVESYRGLLLQCREVVPYLPQSRILMDLRAEMAKRANG